MAEKVGSSASNMQYASCSNLGDPAILYSVYVSLWLYRVWEISSVCFRVPLSNNTVKWPPN